MENNKHKVSQDLLRKKLGEGNLSYDKAIEELVECLSDIIHGEGIDPAIEFTHAEELIKKYDHLRNEYYGRNNE